LPFLGLGAVAVYVALTVAAVAVFPGSSSPADNYLSEFGNAQTNPDGWLFYDLAMVVAGLLAIPFFAGVSGYYAAYGRKWLVRTGLAAGMVNGLAVVMAGAFAEHVDMTAHRGWSLLIFASFLPLLVAHGLIMWDLRGFSRFVGAYGYAVCAADIGMAAALYCDGEVAGAGSVMEWVAVFSYLAWVLLLSADLFRRLGRCRPASR
jgi:hypothetical membrane protein